MIYMFLQSKSIIYFNSEVRMGIYVFCIHRGFTVRFQADELLLVFKNLTFCGKWLIYANYSLREIEQLNLKTMLSSKVNCFEGTHNRYLKLYIPLAKQSMRETFQSQRQITQKSVLHQCLIRAHATRMHVAAFNS